MLSRYVWATQKRRRWGKSNHRTYSLSVSPLGTLTDSYKSLSINSWVHCGNQHTFLPAHSFVLSEKWNWTLATTVLLKPRVISRNESKQVGGRRPWRHKVCPGSQKPDTEAAFVKVTNDFHVVKANSPFTVLSSLASQKHSEEIIGGQKHLLKLTDKSTDTPYLTSILIWW